MTQKVPAEKIAIDSLLIDARVRERWTSNGIATLNPVQEKAVRAGVLDGKSVLVCAPTASGKTLIAELALAKAIERGKRGAYIVPLVALASEKFKSFKKRFDGVARVGLFIGKSEEDHRLDSTDILVCTAEKLDSMLRHNTNWVASLGTVVADEVHLLNDTGRGPTLEVVLTLLRYLKPDIQIVALSATIGNPEELSSWLGAELVKDDWRPVKLWKGVAVGREVELHE